MHASGMSKNFIRNSKLFRDAERADTHVLVAHKYNMT